MEALAMTQSAIDAIEAVKNGRRTNWIRTSANHRKAQMLSKMFGIRAAGIFHTMSSEDLDYLHEIQDVYKSMIQEARREYDGLYWLYVGDEYFTRYSPDVGDSSYIGVKTPLPTVAENIPTCAKYGGWYDGTMCWIPSVKPNEQRSEVFCKCTTAAFTIRDRGSITWCHTAFEDFLTSTQNIKQNQSQIKKFDSLDSYKSLASVWIHEWAHLFSQKIKDQPAYDAYSNRVPNQKSYGFFACADLAKKQVTPSAYLGDPTEPCGKRLAANNADSYTIFAMAMYMDQWDWSSGIAQNLLGM